MYYVGCVWELLFTERREIIILVGWFVLRRTHRDVDTYAYLRVYYCGTDYRNSSVVWEQKRWHVWSKMADRLWAEEKMSKLFRERSVLSVKIFSDFSYYHECRHFRKYVWFNFNPVIASISCFLAKLCHFDPWVDTPDCERVSNTLTIIIMIF